VAEERERDERTLLERLHDPARVLALSDGVFAIIMTLLVLEIHVPELTQGHSLNQALREVRPSLVAFVISFILAGTCCGGRSTTASAAPAWLSTSTQGWSTCSPGAPRA
jgi:hypothetical protein